MSQREFESDYGFATDSIRWIFIRYDANSYTYNVISEVDLRPVFLTIYENATTGGASPTDAVSDDDRDQVAFILDDFHTVQNPRRMTDEYLDMVLDKYDDLADR
ncbi:hypothetical protein [Halorubrum salipaludis]|uniref:hypothetical protein n=1 Tax=Halorubrum salipaludis TaxID=2032630 RepID=UPI0018E982FA|nr:hypothetical protein [Halorubrum salipaludis]